MARKVRCVDHSNARKFYAKFDMFDKDNAKKFTIYAWIVLTTEQLYIAPQKGSVRNWEAHAGLVFRTIPSDPKIKL